MSRRALLAVLSCVLLAGCPDREVRLRIHTPAACPGDPPDAGDMPCPLAPTLSILTRIVRTDGTVAHSTCVRAPGALCAYEDLDEHVFIADIDPARGVEVEIEGFAGAACARPSVFRCDSFGDGVVDLGQDVVALWCECPRRF